MTDRCRCLPASGSMLKTKQLVSQPASRKLSWKSMFRMPEPSVTLSTVNTLANQTTVSLLSASSFTSGFKYVNRHVRYTSLVADSAGASVLGLGVVFLAGRCADVPQRDGRVRCTRCKHTSSHVTNELVMPTAQVRVAAVRYNPFSLQ